MCRLFKSDPLVFLPVSVGLYAAIIMDHPLPILIPNPHCLSLAPLSCSLHHSQPSAMVDLSHSLTCIPSTSTTLSHSRSITQGKSNAMAGTIHHEDTDQPSPWFATTRRSHTFSLVIGAVVLSRCRWPHICSIRHCIPPGGRTPGLLCMYVLS